MIFTNVNEDKFELNNEFKKGEIIYREVRLKNKGCRCTNAELITLVLKNIV